MTYSRAMFNARGETGHPSKPYSFMLYLSYNHCRAIKNNFKSWIPCALIIGISTCSRKVSRQKAVRIHLIPYVKIHPMRENLPPPQVQTLPIDSVRIQLTLPGPHTWNRCTVQRFHSSFYSQKRKITFKMMPEQTVWKIDRNFYILNEKSKFTFGI